MPRSLRLAIIGLFVILVLSLIHYVSWLQPVESLVMKGLEPVQRPMYQLVQSLKNLKSNWLTKRDLLAENQALKNELVDLQVNQSEINSLKQENMVLKQELNFVTDRQLDYVSAQIVTGVSDPTSRSVIINRGAADGITEGMAVVAEQGVLVGKVHAVNQYQSKVLLITDNRSRVAATVQNQEQTVGLVEGQFGLSIAMTNIPQTAEVQENDLIVTSGLEGQIPKNLLIARVETVNLVESDIFKTAVLAPVISLDNLSYVLVIKP